MTTREVVLEGGSPWGFRIQGGVDAKSPLKISRVNSSGKAALKGIREGEIISSINGQSTKNLTYTDAHSLIKNSEDPLRLQLTVDTGSPRQRKRNRASVHETHSETLKSSSSTLYSRYSTKTIFNNESEYAEPDEYLRKQSSIEGHNHSKEHIDPPVSPDSTVSSDVSSCSTLTEAGRTPPSTLSTSPQTDLVMADSANHKSKKKLSKNQRKKLRRTNKQSSNQARKPNSNTTNDINETDVEEEYKVDFPEPGGSKPKLKIKSKSLDDDDVKIQEVEGSGEDDKQPCEAIVSEADSDWEEATNLRLPQNPLPLSTIAISIDEEPLQRVGNFSPEEELCLRNFLEGINLVNSPECQLGPSSTLDSIKQEKARKRDALSQYFIPLAQNPRFLDIISEEGSDLSDRESSSLTRHLKQGTPELENINDNSKKSSPRVARRNKLRRLKLERTEEKAVLVCTKILDTPSIIEHVHSCTTENTEPETVFLESSSENASSENSSDTGISTPEPEEKTEQETEKIVEKEMPKDEIDPATLKGMRDEEARIVSGTNNIIQQETETQTQNETDKNLEKCVETRNDFTSEDIMKDSEAETILDISKIGRFETEIPIQKKIEKTPKKEMPPNEIAAISFDIRKHEETELISSTANLVQQEIEKLSEKNVGKELTETRSHSTSMDRIKGEKIEPVLDIDETRQIKPEVAKGEETDKTPKKEISAIEIDPVTFAISKNEEARIITSTNNINQKYKTIELSVHRETISHKSVSNKKYTTEENLIVGQTEDKNVDKNVRYIPIFLEKDIQTPSSKPNENSTTVETLYGELTPPPTPEHSPKKKLSTDSNLDLDLEACMKDIAVDTAKEITSVLDKLTYGCEKTFIVNQATIPSPETPMLPSLSSRSSSHSSSSSRGTSPSTVRFNPMTSSIADVVSILPDLELARESSLLKQPLSLRQICLKLLLAYPSGTKMLQKLSDLSENLEKLTNAGNRMKEQLESDASLNLMNSHDDNNSNLVSEATEKLKKIMSSEKWAGIPFYNNPNLLLYLSPSQKAHLEKSETMQNGPDVLYDLHSKFSERMGKKEHIEKRLEIKTFEKEEMSKTSDVCYTMKTLPRNFKQTSANPRLDVSNLDDWLDMARKGEPVSTESKRTVKPQEEFTKRKRRISLPDELYQRQLQMIVQKEKEIEQELENLLEEKRKLYMEIRNNELEEENLHQSRENQRPKSFPQSPSETLRQKMYEEYMNQVAEREERKHHKMIKITSAPTSKNAETEKSQFEAVHLQGIEDEFMKRVHERHGPLEKVVEETVQQEDADEDTSTSSKSSQVLLIDGKSVKEATDLPKHLKEFVELTTDSSDSSNGIWSPGQKQELALDFNQQKRQQKNDESIQPIWQPKSATSSPVAERKEYRPISFESPKLGRKNKSEEFQVNNTSEKPTARLPWRDQVPPRGDHNQISTLERRIPNSRSAPSTGFNEPTTPRLPRAQNPTVTLLQKAREGQLPKGANYLEANRDHYRIPHDFSSQGEIIQPRRNDYYSESDSEIFRTSDPNRRKIEGVGPLANDGMPLSLRSEVRDANQSKWYKKMYDTIHKQKPYRDEFVTVRYKPRRAQYPYISGYLSEPEPGAYDSDHMEYKYATLDRRRTPMTEKENFTTSTMPRNAHWRNTSTSDYYPGSKSNPGRIENYIPGHSTISDQESKKWWDEVMDIFDGKLEDDRKPNTKGYLSQALKESGYESDSTLVFRKKEDGSQLSPSEQREAYKIIQKGGDIPLHGLRKPAPERPKEPEPPLPPPKSHQGQPREIPEGSPRKYVENQVTIHYKTPVRQEIKDYFSEDELAHRQQEAMKKMYQEERRRKYLQELQDMHNRRHTDNFIPSQKSPIPLNRYDDFDDLVAPQHKIRPRSPEPRLVARALYNFVGMTPRELTFRKGDNIYVRRQIDKNWYEGELNAMVGLFPVNYVEIVPYESTKSTTTNRKAHEGQARAKYNFLAKTHLELSLAKGEMVIITRRVDNNWYEGKIGGRKGIFPASYVDVLIDPQDPAKDNAKPVAAPAAHSLLLNGSTMRESMGSHTYTPNMNNPDPGSVPSYYAKPVQVNYCNSYGGRNSGDPNNPVNQALHIDTQTAEPIPFKSLYKYIPQNDDELELMEGDTVYVLEKCDDGWFVGSNERTGAFGTFPGNYVNKIQ